MGKKTSILAEKQAQINLLSEEGYSEHQISIRIGVSKTAVHRAIAKFQKYGIYTDRKKSERPLRTSSRDDMTIKFSTSRNLKPCFAIGNVNFRCMEVW